MISPSHTRKAPDSLLVSVLMITPYATACRDGACDGGQHRQPVTAPCAAEPTSLAYLPSTPVV